MQNETTIFSDRQEEALGRKGMHIITDTSAHTPAAGFCYSSIQVIADTVISAALTDSSSPITGTIAGLAIASGTLIFSKFTSLTLTSGKVIAF